MSGNSVDFIWPGLGSYTESEQGLFFGRDDEIARLSETIEEENLCTVYGPSGAGKTSLLLAGVFPRLRKRGWLPIYLRLDHGAGAPSYVRQIIAALTSAADGAGLAVAELCAPLTKDCDETLWEWMHRHVFLNGCKNPVRPVLLIDQFEEMFTLGAGDERVRDCFTELGDLCTNNIPQAVVDAMADSEQGLSFPSDDRNWRMVLSLREDFLPRLEEVSPDHPVFRQNRISVNALTREQALSAVIGPGREIVSETVARSIVDIVGRSATGRLDKVEPALLSLFCSRLDITRRQKGLERITQELLAASEKDILASFYVETTGRVSKKTMSLLEDRLLTTGGYRSSWAVEDAKLEGVRQSEIDTLVNARLLHVDHRGGVSWLEFSHDILTAEARSSRVNRRLLLEKARTRRMAGLLVSLVVLLAAFAVSVWHLFYREYAPCYLRTVKVFGRIQGVGEPLSESDKRQASVYFKLRHHGRYSFHLHAGLGHWFERSPVYRMEAINGRSRPTTEHGMGTYLWHGEDVLSGGSGMVRGTSEKGGSVAQTQSSDEMKKVCAWEFSYGYDGRPLSEFGVDREDKLVWGCTHAPCTDADQWRSNTVVHFVDARGFPLRQRLDDAEYVEITYDAETGFERRVVYYDASGRITKGLDGAECHEQCFNDRGLCTQLTSKAWSEADGRFTNIIDNAGNTGMWTEYLSNDMVSVSHSFGLNGELRPVGRGVLIHLQTYDRLNRILCQRFLGTNGVECVYDENGWSRIENSYYENGVTKCTDIYAPTGCGGIWGYTNVHHVIRLYDAQGNETEQSFWDVDGKPTAGNNQAAKTCRKFVKFGDKFLCTEERYFDGAEKASADKNGVAILKTAYDQSGRMVRTDLYAPKGCGGIWGYERVHHVIRLYDANGNEIEQSFWDADGKPTSGNEGVVKICRRFEGINRCVEEWFPGTSDQLTTNCNGIARTVTKYGGDSCVIKQKLMFGMFGHGGLWGVPDLQLAIHDYDGRGNVVTQRCFSANGSLIACADGTAFVTVKHDERGQKRRIDGYAPVGKGGIWGYEKAHHVIRLYDADGNEVEQSFWDVDGKPTAGNNRAAKTCKRYAKFGDKFLCTEEWYLDGEENETANENGIANLQAAYDQSGKMTRMDHYAPKGCGGIWGCEALHHVVCHYDSNGKKAERYYGSNEHEINLVGVAMATEIVQASQAEIRKVAIGDVVCGYGKYRLNASDCFDDLMASIQALGQCDKTLTIARKRGDDYEIKTFDFPPGPMGIRFVDRKLIDRDFEKIQRAYRLHLEKVKAKE